MNQSSARDLVMEFLQMTYVDMPDDALRQHMLNRLQGATKTAIDESGALPWVPSWKYHVEKMAERAALAALPESERRVLDWPWDSWNDIVEPLEPGLLAVIGGGDGMGKTIYAECIGEHWAIRGARIVFVHFELNHWIMTTRRACRHTGIPYRAFANGDLTPDQTSVYNDVRSTLEHIDGNIIYQHAPGWSAEKVVEYLANYKATNDCDGVIIDYLEKVGPSDRQIRLYGQNAFQREADNVEQFKTFAEASGTPTLLLAQLSKAGKTTGAAQMDRTAIRGAGEKTEKANVVALLSRERMADGVYSPDITVRIDKNTVGRTGVLKQGIQGPRFRVLDLATS